MGLPYDSQVDDGNEFSLDFSEALDNTGNQAVDVVKAAVLASFQSINSSVSVNDITVTTTNDSTFNVKYDSSVVGGSNVGSLNLPSDTLTIQIGIGSVSDVDGNTNPAIIQFVAFEGL